MAWANDSSGVFASGSKGGVVSVPFLSLSFHCSWANKLPGLKFPGRLGPSAVEGQAPTRTLSLGLNHLPKRAVLNFNTTLQKREFYHYIAAVNNSLVLCLDKQVTEGTPKQQ